MELEDWMSSNGYDICAMTETGLNGGEYVELGRRNYSWYEMNRGWMKSKSGGVVITFHFLGCMIVFSLILFLILSKNYLFASSFVFKDNLLSIFFWRNVFLHVYSHEKEQIVFRWIG